MVKVIHKTMNDRTKAKIIVKENDNSYNTLNQEIKRVFTNEVTVVSNQGKLYNVRLSDRVKLTMSFEVGDIAVIKTFKDNWLVVDIIKQEKYDDEFSVLIKKKFKGIATSSELERLKWLEENDVELQIQKREIEDMFGAY